MGPSWLWHAFTEHFSSLSQHSTQKLCQTEQVSCVELISIVYFLSVLTCIFQATATSCRKSNSRLNGLILMLKDSCHLILFQNLISLIILVFILSWIRIFLIKEFSVQEKSNACLPTQLYLWDYTILFEGKIGSLMIKDNLL